MSAHARPRVRREPFDRVVAVFDYDSSECGRNTCLMLMTGDDHCRRGSRASAQRGDGKQTHAPPADNEDGTISRGGTAQRVQRYCEGLGQHSHIRSETFRDEMDLTCMHDDLVAPTGAQTVGEADRISVKRPPINVFTGPRPSGCARSARRAAVGEATEQRIDYGEGADGS